MLDEGERHRAGGKGGEGYIHFTSSQPHTNLAAKPNAHMPYQHASWC